MCAFRSFPLLTRAVLAWFVCALAASVLSPAVNPKVMARLCGADGLSRVVQFSERSGEAQTFGTHEAALDCPLCLLGQVPLPGAAVDRIPIAPPVSGIVSAHYRSPVAAEAGAPLPARGPPRRSV